MTMMTKIFVAGAGLAALAAAAPSAAQYAYQNQYANPYGNSSQYGYANRYGYNNNMTAMATQQCSAAVQNRLSRRNGGGGLGGIVGALFGANNNGSGRVLGVTRATPRGGYIRVQGLASSGSRAGYGQYGAGAYGALGYSYQPDLSFRCDVDFRGQVRNVDINRR